MQSLATLRLNDHPASSRPRPVTPECDDRPLRPTDPVSSSLTGLRDLVSELENVRIPDVRLNGVCTDSANVRLGDLYIALPGAVRHGAEFSTEARSAGAVAVLTDTAGADRAAASGLPTVVVDSPRSALASIAAWVYRRPATPLTLFGVTGTNGKTSTVYLLDALLRQLGVASGLSATPERRVLEQSVTSRLTTPEADELHALLARMREDGIAAAAVEVSAQGISARRVDGIRFDVALFTNLTHDHLDDYPDMEAYFAAKAAFFTSEHARRGVISLDTGYGQRLARSATIPIATVSAGAQSDGDWRVQIDRRSTRLTEFTLEGPLGERLTTRVPLLGDHMAMNASLAIVALVEAGIPFPAVAAAIGADPIGADQAGAGPVGADQAGADPVGADQADADPADADPVGADPANAGVIDVYIPGRTERISGDCGPAVYVDFAHDPDAFAKTLEGIRRVTEGKVIMVMGADGDRDPSKRHPMGRLASEGSDLLIITDHHPRFEDPHLIRRALVEGASTAPHPAVTYEIAASADAIRKAISLADPCDSILWAGPGLTDYQIVGAERMPYSPRQDIRLALVEAGWA